VIQLRDLCFGKSRPRDANDAVAKHIPLFITQENQSVAEMEMRLTTQGLSLVEIDQILEAISRENQAHPRRTGKARLSCEIRLDQGLLDDDITVLEAR
jgi:hypothetical protein